MFALAHLLHKIVQRMDCKRDRVTPKPSKGDRRSRPSHMWGNGAAANTGDREEEERREQTGKRKRRLQSAVVGDGGLASRKRHTTKRATVQTILGGEGGPSTGEALRPVIGHGGRPMKRTVSAKVSTPRGMRAGNWRGKAGNAGAKGLNAELERYRRLLFGPALGTRSMTRWRVASGIVSRPEIPGIRDNPPTEAQPENPAAAETPDQACVKETEQAPSVTTDPAQTSEKFEEFYRKGELIGHGGYGSVYAGYRKSDNLPVALKFVDQKQIKMWAKMSEAEEVQPLEIALLRQVCRSPVCAGVAQLLDYFELPGVYLLVLERPEPCLDLFNYMQEEHGYLDEPLARHILCQVVGALLHCHARGVVHRDLKPENILLETATRRVKLLDFGSATVLKDGAYTDVAGTPEYFPPETVLRGEYFAIPATVWSLGILLFQMVWGDVPFYSDAGIVKATLYFPRGISRDCRHLIRRCLAVNPDDRPTLEQILQHPWMQ